MLEAIALETDFVPNVTNKSNIMYSLLGIHDVHVVLHVYDSFDLCPFCC